MSKDYSVIVLVFNENALPLSILICNSSRSFPITRGVEYLHHSSVFFSIKLF